MGYVFGPVSSRRLGRSLGVDLLPYMPCTYASVNCQIGRTTLNTAERRTWAPIAAVLDELSGKLPSLPDYITLGGSGEPTLFSELGELIKRIKQMTSIPVAVLTNGSLFWRKDVRDDLLLADVVIPSLDAGSVEKFQCVNRPVKSISFDQMIEGLIAFRREYRGAYWLEILLVAGHTDSEAEVQKLAEQVRRIQPDRVQLNTVTRPPADSGVSAVSPERLAELARLFTPPAEVVADFRSDAEPSNAAGVTCEEVLDTVRRHPSSVDDLAKGLGAARAEVLALVAVLLEEGRISESLVGGITYYQAC